MMQKLIVVFDAQHAKFFHASGFKITEVKETFQRDDFNIAREHPSKKESRGQSAAPGGAQHLLEPHGHENIKEVEREEFCRIIAQKLKEIFQVPHPAFNDLILVADPKSLGTLRTLLEAKVQERLRAEHAKDLIHLTEKELEAHLFS